MSKDTGRDTFLKMTSPDPNEIIRSSPADVEKVWSDEARAAALEARRARAGSPAGKIPWKPRAARPSLGREAAIPQDERDRQAQWDDPKAGAPRVMPERQPSRPPGSPPTTDQRANEMFRPKAPEADPFHGANRDPNGKSKPPANARYQRDPGSVVSGVRHGRRTTMPTDLSKSGPTVVEEKSEGPRVVPA